MEGRGAEKGKAREERERQKGEDKKGKNKKGKGKRGKRRRGPQLKFLATPCELTFLTRNRMLLVV